MPIALALPPPQPAFEISVANRGMSQGVMQTDGAQVVSRAYVQIGAAQIGGQWKNVGSTDFNGVAAIFLKFRHKIPQGQLDAGVIHKIRTGANGSTDSRAWEFMGGARKSFGRPGLRLTAEYSPKEFERGRSLYVEFGPTFDVDRFTRISANVGRRERVGAPDYTAFNAGITRMFAQKLTFDARYHGTNRSELGPRFRGRVIVSARLSLLNEGNRK